MVKARRHRERLTMVRAAAERASATHQQAPPQTGQRARCGRLRKRDLKVIPLKLSVQSGSHRQ